MLALDQISYSCALRAKRGELAAMAMLRDDVAARMLPRLIIAPEKEKNKAQLSLLSDLGCLNLVPDLHHAWRSKPVIVDPTYVLDQFGRDRMADWFTPAIIDAVQAGSPAIPCIRLVDFEDEVVFGFRSSCEAAGGYFGITLTLSEAADPSVLERLASKLGVNGFDLGKGIIFGDFVKEDFKNPEFVSPVIEGAFETILESAPWLKVIFQASSYPEANPASENSAVVIGRGEWFAFRDVADSRPDLIGRKVLFGDYGADSGRIDFNAKSRRAYPHLRYNLGESWMVARGSNKGDFAQSLRSIASHIVAHAEYSGPGFSDADLRIQQIADGIAGPGNASDWRAINMCHHITKVVADFGSRFDYSVHSRAVSANPTQVRLPHIP